MRVPYPRTPHLPWSPGVSADDLRVGDLSGLRGREVVVTEKLDGENTTLYRDGLHARSLDSAHHPSRAWLKALHGRIATGLPAGWRICGENVYARHSIGYRDLASWFYAFSVWLDDRCLDWDRTVRFTRRLGLPVPPVLWRGTFDERALRALRVDPTRQEGYVVRSVDGFTRTEFAGRVAKWVRRDHVRTDAHWMLAPVIPNDLGRHAALWEVRSGGPVDVPALTAATLDDSTPDHGTAPRHDSVDPSGVPQPVDRVEEVVADVRARLDLLGRSGDPRLAGVLAALYTQIRPPGLPARLVAPLGMPLARRVADLVELHTGPHRPFPDETRRAGLIRLADGVDVGVLHAVAAAVLTGRDDAEGAEAREQVAWSELHADEAGLLGEAPLRPLRAGLRTTLRGYDPDVADRCWAETRQAYADGRIDTPEEAPAATWRWRSGQFPRLVVTVGPAGSGKSTFAGSLPGVTEVVSLDELRQARGSRADQRANAAVLRAGLDRLDTLLAGGGTVVWDATALTRQQRSLVHTVARRRDALTTHAVLLVPADLLARRNSDRAYPVPPEVLDGQLRRFRPPWAGEAHRTWYVGQDGTIDDVAGSLDDEEPDIFAAAEPLLGEPVLGRVR